MPFTPCTVEELGCSTGPSPPSATSFISESSAVGGGGAAVESGWSECPLVLGSNVGHPS